jgi:hypothetical protein
VCGIAHSHHTLKKEKIQVLIDREAAVVVEQKKNPGLPPRSL